jgi:hypothetical protein
MDFKRARGYTLGPAISDTNGPVFSDALLELLEELFELFPPLITSKEISETAVSSVPHPQEFIGHPSYQKES